MTGSKYHKGGTVPPPPWKVINYIACGNYKVERIKEDKMWRILKDCRHLRSAVRSLMVKKTDRARFRGEGGVARRARSNK